MNPPKTAQHPYVHEEQGVKRADPYHWLVERDNSEVIAHLQAENA